MRIVYLHQYFRTPQMAGGTRSYEFARRLVARGHDVHIVTSDEQPEPCAPRWRRGMEAGIDVHWAAVPYTNSMGYRQRINAFGHFARVAARYAARIPQDLVIATSTPLTIALPAAYSAQRNRVPMVFEVRDLWPEAPIAMGALRSPVTRWAGWRLESFAYHRASHVVALSRHMSESIRSRFPDTPVTVIPNGCDLDMFENADVAGRALRAATPWLGDRPLVLYAGALGSVNNVGYIVEMAIALKEVNPEIRFAIVGDGREQEHIRLLAARSGVLGATLFMLGKVSKVQVRGWFGAATLSLSTVVNNPLLQGDSANKVYDALAAACPVGVNHGGALSDQLLKEQAGLVLPASDPKAGALAVAAFVRDAELVTKARYNARRLAGNYSRDVLFDQFEGVIMSTIDGRHQRVPLTT